jgi:ribose transport system ATP-binding protein
VLELSGIEKAFGTSRVLRGVSLSVAAGEVHALLGENGAGKSTLMRILLGIERADGGVMRLDGAPYAPRSPREARARGVVMVPQERTLCPDLTVAENVVLGLEPVRGGFIDEATARTTAERVLGLVTGSSKTISPDVRAHRLGVADQQLVEIARALAQGEASSRVRVMVLDEPTSSLGHDDAVRLFARVRALAESGIGIILVTHFLSDVREHTARYTVLRDGTVQGSGDSKTTLPDEIARAMIGPARSIAAPAARGTAQAEESDRPAALSATGLGGADRPRSATFEVRRGEIFGIAGLVGSGRTELLRLIAGLDRPSRGDVRVTAAKGIGLLSEDRGGEGLMLGRSIADNVTLSPRGGFWIRPAELLAEATRWIAELSVKATGPEQAVSELSGGNQQKVQLARLLREDFEVLLVDEPTRGVDVASKAQILGLLRDLAERGKSVVLVSSQFDELVSTCDRIAVLRRGELDPARAAAEWTEESLLVEASQ